PQSYRAGTASDQTLFRQHDAQWVAPDIPGAGNILIFNNGNRRPEGSYSSVDEIAPTVDANGHYILDSGFAYGPEELIWAYTAENPGDFYADKISGAQRLPNGNTLICSGTDGTFFEVTAAGEIVWKYVNPVTRTGLLAQGEVILGDHRGFANAVFRAYRYALDYPGLAGQDLSPGESIEQ
ncbi:MAG: arylsulfotransferase (ASST), partial [bacterium]|nr:arylsulfotransferase (ASST) [bacterium]